MGVDIGVVLTGEATDSRSFLPEPPPVTLEWDDGYSSFFHPFIEELAKETGQYICLHDDAIFCGPHLPALRNMLESAQRAVENQPPVWHQHYATQTRPDVKELYTTVDKAAFIGLLDQFVAIVEYAKGHGYCVLCFGD